MADALTKLQTLTLKLVGPALLTAVAAGSVGGTVLYQNASTVETTQAAHSVRIESQGRALEHASAILERLVERVASIESNRFTDKEGMLMEARIMAYHNANTPPQEVRDDLAEIKLMLREMDARQRAHEKDHAKAR